MYNELSAGTSAEKALLGKRPTLLPLAPYINIAALLGLLRPALDFIGFLRISLDCIRIVAGFC